MCLMLYFLRRGFSLCVTLKLTMQIKHEFVSKGLRLWREMNLSIALKPHAVEDHLCDQAGRLLGINDLGEDFVEQSHQSGMKYNNRSRTIKHPLKVAHYQCNWEHQDHHPLVKMKSDEIKKHSTRTKQALVDGSGEVMIVGISRREEKQQKIHDGKDEVRKNALKIISTPRERKR